MFTSSTQNNRSNSNITDAITTLRLLVHDEMIAVDKLLRDFTHSDLQLILDIGQHIILSGGKRLRPMLTLIVARLCKYEGEHHIILATAIECMHTATLLHDDVVDKSDKRRNAPTARLEWGNAASVLIGDFMLAQAFKLMVLTNNITTLDILSSAATIISEGEVLQLTTSNNLDIDKETSLRIIASKTATLFSAATEIAGVISHVDNQTREQLKSYGYHLGMAFQLIDDVLDYTHNNMSKNIGDDFYEGKMTFPLLLAYHHSSVSEKNFCENIFKNRQYESGDLEKIILLMQKYNTLEQTVEYAKEYTQKAKEIMHSFPDNDYRDALINILDFCIHRVN